MSIPPVAGEIRFVPHKRVRAVVRDLGTLYNVGPTAGLTDGQLLERFATRVGEAAELAFAALVERHGPMVLRTCRGVLRDEHDALDAFQATFLILARKGGTLWVRDSLGPWLHRVSCRVAVHSSRAANRRRTAERQAAELAVRSEADSSRGDLARGLHEEIDRLPDRYRLPIILCDLDGRTHDEAARHLRCPVGTVKSRLARGRERLRGRLHQRGITPSSAVLLAETAAARPSIAALEVVARAASEAMTGKVATAGAARTSALSLADGALRSMMLSKLRRAAASVLATVIVCVGAAQVAGRSSGALEPPSERDDVPVAARQGGGKTTEERRVPPFDEIRVVGKIKVVVTPGPDHQVTAIGDAGLLRALRSRVVKESKHDRLLLELSHPDVGREGLKAGDGPVGVEVRITLPRLSAVIAEAGATVEAHALRNESLSLTARDTAKIEVSGSSDRLTAELHDSANLDASRLDTGQASVTASERSSGVFRARETLSVVASGEARVEYLGTPTRLNEITFGRSRLIQR
jgi:RNA polymerase sigma factor (sigma-70 family)